MGTLPVGYRPSGNIHFPAFNYFTSSDIPNYANTTYITVVDCNIASTGEISIRWVKPASGVSTYSLVFSSILDLLA